MTVSNIFIPNQALRRRFRKEADATGISQLGIMGLVACEAAYGKGEVWYQSMLSYAADNIAFLKEYVEKNLPGVRMVEHEGTYLVWLDFRGLSLDTRELEELIVHRARLWLDGGEIFGECGRGFERINAACPRSVLEKALERIRKAIWANGIYASGASIGIRDIGVWV